MITFQRELARGTLELAVLSLLRAGERYGYELLSLLNNASGGTPEIREGTLYPLLHRLEDAKFIASRWQTHDRERPRKYYGLTPRGQARCQALIAEWNRVVVGMSRIIEQGGTP